MKQESISAYDTWLTDGRPSSGPSFDAKKDCHYQYKSELRKRRRILAAERSERMSTNLLSKDFSGFWKTWRNTTHANAPPVNRIGDAVTRTDIAGAFQSYFQDIYGDNDSEAHQNLRRQFEGQFPDYFTSRQHLSIGQFFLSWHDMMTITGKLKVGKRTNENVTAEHILYGSPKLIVHLHLIFNALF